MSNLLPPEEKKAIRRDYAVRLIAVALFALAAAGVVASALHFPAYVFSGMKERILRSDIEILNKRTGGDLEASMKAAIGEINSRLQLFPDQPKDMPISKQVIAPLLEQRRSGVKITGIVYSVEHGEKVVTVSGFAATRSDLTGYVERLKGVPGFTEVTLPISSFVKDRNLDFSLIINVSL